MECQLRQGGFDTSNRNWVSALELTELPWASGRGASIGAFRRGKHWAERADEAGEPHWLRPRRDQTLLIVPAAVAPSRRVRLPTSAGIGSTVTATAAIGTTANRRQRARRCDRRDTFSALEVAAFAWLTISTRFGGHQRS